MTYEESFTVELKREINADFKKEIVAFANSEGRALRLTQKQELLMLLKNIVARWKTYISNMQMIA